MSLPRPVVKGRSWMVTRRCSERRFFLVPCRATRWAVLYAVGVAAERFGVELHALQQMSNHLHIAAYRVALEAYRLGLEVVFPAGTYQLYVEGHVSRHPT